MTKSLRNFIFWLLHTPVGFVLSVIYRVLNEAKSDLVGFLKKLLLIGQSREIVNFTYQLSPQSRAILPHMVAQLTGVSHARANAVIAELEQDQELARYYAEAIRTSNRKWASDEAFKPGRLLLHYALVRLTKPRCVVEAGLDKGLGAIIMNRALQRNQAEGYEARYIGVEYRADRPAFLLEQFPDRISDVVYASWYEVVEKLPLHSIDFMFYDAVVMPFHLQKLVELSNRLSPESLTVSAWAFPEFVAIADRIGRSAAVFSARPDRHWEYGNDLCIFHKATHKRLSFQPLMPDH